MDGTFDLSVMRPNLGVTGDERLKTRHASAPDTPSIAAAERFVALYQKEFATLTRVANALVGDWAMAEDIVQTVFAEVFRRWGSLNDIEGMGAYLNQAVIYRCRSHYRSAAREANHSWFGDRVSSTDPADHVVAGASRPELREALALLSPRQRECVVAHFILGQTESETAAMLDISVGSVRTHTRRGLQALKKAMGR